MYSLIDLEILEENKFDTTYCRNMSKKPVVIVRSFDIFEDPFHFLHVEIERQGRIQQQYQRGNSNCLCNNPKSNILHRCPVKSNTKIVQSAEKQDNKADK